MDGNGLRVGERRILDVFVVSDSPRSRSLLRRELEREHRIRIAGDAQFADEALELIERARPDLLVAELLMPSRSGARFFEAVRQRSPGTRILVVSVYKEEDGSPLATRHGAHGYVDKTEAPEGVVAAVLALGSR